MSSAANELLQAFDALSASDQQEVLDVLLKWQQDVESIRFFEAAAEARFLGYDAEESINSR